MSHIEMMQLAQKNARYGDCVERQVGAVAVFENGDVISSCNSAAWDSTNDNHAESKLVAMAGLMRKDLSGATLYTTCRPCARCTDMLATAWTQSERARIKKTSCFLVMCLSARRWRNEHT